MNLNPASITELRFLLDEDKEKGLKNIPKKILTKEGKITKKAIEYNKKLLNKNVLQVYLTTNRDLRKEYHVEDFEVGSPDITLNTDLAIDVTWEGYKRAVGKYLECPPHMNNSK